MYVTICIKCGRLTTDVPKSKYCGDGTDKDNGHRYVKVSKEKLEELDRIVSQPRSFGNIKNSI
jgi:hypothetical protein